MVKRLVWTAEELLSSGFVAAPLSPDIQHGTMLVHGAPEVVGLAIDLEQDLVAVPLIAGAAGWRTAARTSNTTGAPFRRSP
jgi:hypothetical protein